MTADCVPALPRIGQPAARYAHNFRDKLSPIQRLADSIRRNTRRPFSPAYNAGSVFDIASLSATHPPPIALYCRVQLALENFPFKNSRILPKLDSLH
jgi:hypothetical protein